MCNPACLTFIRDNLKTKEVKGKFILDVGARDLNGSARDHVTTLKPKEYVGTDIEKGPGVDLVCNAVDLIATFGEGVFDVVITTEMLEHVEDWKTVIHNLKTVLKPNGLLLITTRSKGFPYHEYPGDHWRYQLDDMYEIFADFEILVMEPDPIEPGVFVKAVKPEEFTETDLSGYELYSIQTENEPPTTPTAPGQYVPEDKPPHQWGIA